MADSPSMEDVDGSAPCHIKLPAPAVSLRTHRGSGAGDAVKPRSRLRPPPYDVRRRLVGRLIGNAMNEFRPRVGLIDPPDQPLLADDRVGRRILAIVQGIVGLALRVADAGHVGRFMHEGSNAL